MTTVIKRASRSTIEKTLTLHHETEGSYYAVWTPDGCWGKSDTSVQAWVNACRPKRFLLYLFPDDLTIKSVDWTGFGVAFAQTEDGERKAQAFRWYDAVQLQVGV